MRVKRLTLGAAAAAAGILAWRGLTRAERYDLDGRVVVVTGGGRGLGLEIAREAARRGAKIGLCSRSGVELDKARRDFAEHGVTAATSICDVRDAGSVGRAFDELADRLGPIDVLVNDAGIIGVGPRSALTLDDYRDAMDTNFFGAVHAIETVLPSMRERGAGRIVNVTSIGGKIPVPHLLPYCASKFAFVGYSEGLRAELAREGIVVTTIVPGLMRTGSPRNATFAGQTRKEYALFSLADSLPMTSVSVRHAASRILDACERGEAETVISWQAKAAIAVRALSPGLLTLALEIAGRLLPDAGRSVDHAPGSASESAVTRSPLTAMTRVAEETQHEKV